MVSLSFITERPLYFCTFLNTFVDTVLYLSVDNNDTIKRQDISNKSES